MRRLPGYSLLLFEFSTAALPHRGGRGRDAFDGRRRRAAAGGHRPDLPAARQPLILRDVPHRTPDPREDRPDLPLNSPRRFPISRNRETFRIRTRNGEPLLCSNSRRRETAVRWL